MNPKYYDYKNFAIITSSFILWVGIIRKEHSRLKANLKCVSEIDIKNCHEYLYIPSKNNPIHLFQQFNRHWLCWLGYRWIIKCCQSKDIGLNQWSAKILATQYLPEFMLSCISQVLDLKMSVMIALSYENVNQNFFKKRLPVSQSQKNIVVDLLKFVKSLEIVDVCAIELRNVAINKHLMTISFNNKISNLCLWDFEGENLEDLSHHSQIIVLLLEVLILQSQNMDELKCLYTPHAIIIFKQLLDEYSNKLDDGSKLIFKLLIRIITNISTDFHSHELLFQAGWIGVLANLLNCNDLSLKLMASNILRNIYNNIIYNDKSQSTAMLGNDSVGKSITYSDNVFLLNPVHLNGHDSKLDVVLIHGLHGGTSFTWRQRDEAEHKTTLCWPKDWLFEDVDSLRIIGVDYETCLSFWNSFFLKDPLRLSLSKQADKVMKRLEEAGIGDRPIIWIAHSMGGLLLKEMLRLNSCREKKEICEMTRGIIFMSVPHLGSNHAILNVITSRMFYPTLQATQLRQENVALKKLDDWFVDFASKKKKVPTATLR